MRFFSKGTLAYAFFIVASASFMQQVREALDRAFGAAAVNGAFRAAWIALAVAVTAAALKRPPRLALSAATAGLFILASLLIAAQPFFSERTHVVTYGILGFAAFRDVRRFGTLAGIGAAAGLVLAAGLADEAFQGLLPYRNGDLRDVLTNFLGGFLGVLLGRVFCGRR
jgi:hypothetical protein